MAKSILGNANMQETGVHYMGANLKQEVSAEDIKEIADKRQQEFQAYLNNLAATERDIKDTEDKVLVPTAGRVIVQPYDKNPYRVAMHQKASGLILGDFNTMTFKNPDSGEVEEREKGIWCCRVVAVGSECKTVQVGEDVYINFAFSSPLPFGDYGYSTISENNIICSVRIKK